MKRTGFYLIGSIILFFCFCTEDNFPTNKDKTKNGFYQNTFDSAKIVNSLSKTIDSVYRWGDTTLSYLNVWIKLKNTSQEKISRVYLVTHNAVYGDSTKKFLLGSNDRGFSIFELPPDNEIIEMIQFSHINTEKYSEYYIHPPIVKSIRED